MAIPICVGFSCGMAIRSSHCEKNSRSKDCQVTCQMSLSRALLRSKAARSLPSRVLRPQKTANRVRADRNFDALMNARTRDIESYSVGIYLARWLFLVPLATLCPFKTAGQQSVSYVKNDTWWRAELVKSEAPAYPRIAKVYQCEGNGLFHLTINPANGKVTNVTLVKSTGFGVLDNSAMFALRQWVWRPKRLTKVDIPVRFELNHTGRFKPPPPDASPLPRSRY